MTRGDEVDAVGARVRPRPRRAPRPRRCRTRRAARPRSRRWRVRRRVSMPLMPGTPWRTRRSSRLPVARQLLWCGREVAHDDARAERAAALVVVGVHAVVADVRVGEGDHLPRVRRVGHDLLVARERGVEHQLARRRPRRVGPECADRLAFELRAVGEDEQCVVAHRVASPSLHDHVPGEDGVLAPCRCSVRPS